MLYALIVSVMVSAEPVALDNGALRVEVDPEVFGVRFVGAPGGWNFVEPLDVSEEEREGAEWLDAGGLQTDLAPESGKDGAIRRGPAEVVEQSERSVAMLGPVSEALGVRVRKEVVLAEKEPKARFTVTVLGEGKKDTPLAVRNTVRVPASTTLRVMKADGRIRPLAGSDRIVPMVVRSMKYWLIPVPPTARTSKVVLGALVPTVIACHRSELWTRRLADVPDEGDAPNGCTLLCLLDDDTKSYGAALQGRMAEVREGQPLVMTEEWELE